MCGRIQTLTQTETHELIDVLNQAGSYELTHQPREQAITGATLPLIFPDDSQLTTQDFNWGFKLDWNPRPIINTRIESREKDIWRASFEQRRALLPVAAFYEPLTRELDDEALAQLTNLPKNRLRAFKFESPARTPLLLATIFEKNSFSVVTTAPGPEVGAVHNRSPLIISPQDIELWFSSDYLSLATKQQKLLRSAEIKVSKSNSSDQLSLF